MTAAGHADGLQRRSGERRPPGALGAGELLEVERVAARLLVELVRPLASDGVAEQVAGRLAREAAQLEPSEAALAIGALERRREAIGDLTRACGHHDEHGRVGRAAQERGEQLHRRGVRPVDVVEGEHERPARREPLEQLAHRAVGAVALVLQRGSRRQTQAPTADGSTCASSLRTSSLKAATSRGSSPATYSSRASTKTQNGRSRSSSDALPPRTVHPRASARLASSASRRVLPIPGSPWITSASRLTVAQFAEGAIDRFQFGGAPDERGRRPWSWERRPARRA